MPPATTVRVLLDYRPALRQPTGVGAYVHEAARALVATAGPGETLTLLSASWKDRLAPDAVPGATVVDRRIPVRALNFAWHRLGWPAVERLAGAPFDVIQSAHPLLIPSRHAARLVTIYDLDFLDHPQRYPREIGRDYPRFARAHAQRADRIVTISGHTAKSISERLGVPVNRISVCPPGAPDSPARSSEPDSTTGCILFVGTLEPRKNLGTLLDAYERIVGRTPETSHLVLAGRHTAASAPLLARLRQAPLAGRVDAPGYVDDRTKRDLLERALVMVLPSHTEGFGMPATEAMAAGVPVIAARRGALPEVIGSAGRLIDPDDPVDLAAALTEVLESAETRRRMTEAGLAQVKAFTWHRTAAALREAWQLAHETHRQRHG